MTTLVIFDKANVHCLKAQLVTVPEGEHFHGYVLELAIDSAVYLTISQTCYHQI